LQDREANKTLDVVTRQLNAVAALLSKEQWASVVIAYEPVWYVSLFLPRPPANHPIVPFPTSSIQ